MSQSGSSLKIDTEPQVVIIRRHDAVIASTKSAVLVHSGEVPIYYIPRQDVYEEQLVENTVGSAPVGGGQARFWSVSASGGGVENAVWMLVDPQGHLELLSGYLGFDPNPFNITVG